MSSAKLINTFYHNIDMFNKQAIMCIKRGEVETAIEIYKNKIKYIGYSYEFDVISYDKALSMSENTKRLIDMLETYCFE